MLSTVIAVILSANIPVFRFEQESINGDESKKRGRARKGEGVRRDKTGLE